MKKDPFKQAGRIDFRFTCDSQGRKKLDSVDVVPPIQFDEKKKAREFIQDDWDSGLLHECVKGYPDNEVEWLYEPRPGGKWEIVLNFLHEETAEEYYLRSCELLKGGHDYE